MPHALAYGGLEVRRLEIRALPALLSPGADHLERTILSPAPLDRLDAPDRCDPVSLRGLSLQFRKFPAVQGKVFLAQGRADSRAKGGNASPRVNKSDFLDQEFLDQALRRTYHHLRADQKNGSK
jgi:hypothetical protein